tara:strand:- start:340 stop:633 length:294 start_codon:yes stop_codon:yes gene_type:complete
MNLTLVYSNKFNIPRKSKNNKFVKKIRNIEQRKVQKLTKIFDVCKQHTQDDLSYLREIVKEVKDDFENSTEENYDENTMHTPEIVIEEVDDEDFFEK